MSQSATSPRAVVYGRESHSLEKSIEDQVKLGATVTAEHGWTHAGSYDDGTSASRYATKARQGWDRLLADLEVGAFEVLVLWEATRGDRTLASWATLLDTCRSRGVRIHVISDERTFDLGRARDYRDLATAGVDGAYESDRTAERVRRGKAAAHLAGRPANKLDYGYKRVYDMSKTPPVYLRQDPHPEQAPVVRQIMTRLGGGHSLYAVAAELHQAGTPTARGAGRWHPGSVRSIATNPRYRPHPDNPERGCLVRKGQLYVGTWPPLVDERTWQAVQRVLGTDDPDRRKARRDSAPGAVKHLLSGSRALLTAPCGSDVSGHRARPGRSAHYQCIADGCASVAMAEADEFVGALVVARLARRDARELWVVNDAAARAAGEELAGLEGELEQWRRLAEDREVEPVAYARVERKLLPRIEDARRRSRPAGLPLAMLELIEAGQFGAEAVAPAWAAMPLLARRDVIATLFARLVLGPVTQRITRHTSPAERLAIVARRIEVDWRQA